ncbi:hypothetical protein GGH12_006113 [Coemansia sp. RSA 1822]|nr:hypothetical protein GGH12_006113 [Coemansia sp. RSA 1822]
MQIQDAVRQASLATTMLDFKVLQSWSGYCRSENMVGTATLAQLLAFLKATYDSISSAYQALDELVALSFNAGEDLPAFNQKFDFLLSRADFPADQAALALNHYRRAMPVDIKKELFAADITNVSQAKNRALVLWRTRRSLQKEMASKTDGPAPMEIFKVNTQTQQRRGMRYNADQFPCSEQEFEQRLNSRMCLYCGRNNHIYRNCRARLAKPGIHNNRLRQLSLPEAADDYASTELGNGL